MKARRGRCANPRVDNIMLKKRARKPSTRYDSLSNERGRGKSYLNKVHTKKAKKKLCGKVRLEPLTAQQKNGGTRNPATGRIKCTRKMTKQNCVPQK